MHININAIAQRSGKEHSDADFMVVQCTQCGTQFLYDEERLILYSDPEDLSRQILNIEPASPLPCPQCRAIAWDFKQCESEVAVRDGRWGWILK